MSQQFWERVSGSDIGQGDLLLDCLVPTHPVMSDVGMGEVFEATVSAPLRDLIILSQDCDLAADQNPITWVLLCPIYKASAFLETNLPFQNASRWETLEQQNIVGLGWLPAIGSGILDNEALIVNYRDVLSLDYSYLCTHAQRLDERWRLGFPYKHAFVDSFSKMINRPALPDPPSVLKRKAELARKSAEKAAKEALRRQESSQRRAYFLPSETNN